MSNVESFISTLEKEIAKIDTELLINYEETISKPHFFDKYQEKKKKLKKLMTVTLSKKSLNIIKILDL